MTLPNGAAGLDYTTWGISGTDGSLPDQATRTEDAIKAALAASYKNTIAASSSWATIASNLIDGVLKQVWLAVTGGTIPWDTAKSAAEHLFDWVGTLAGGLSSGLQALLGWLDGLFTDSAKAALEWILGLLSGNIQTLFDPLVGFLTWLWTNFGSAVESFLKPIVSMFHDLVSSFGATTFSGIMTEISNLVHGLLTSFGNLDIIGTIADFFHGILDQFGSLTSWLTSLPSIGDLLTMVASMTGGAFSTLESAVAGLIAWVQDLPVLGPLIKGLTGQWSNPATGTNNTLPDLIAWAGDILNINSILPSVNLTGWIPSDLLSLIPASHVGDTQPNLISDSAFSAASSFEAGSGWTWDGGVTHTVGGGGAAKATCDGGVKTVFSNLIQVAAGQELTLSVWTRWTKPNTTPVTINASLRGYNAAGSVMWTQQVAATTATVMLGDWTQITGKYTIPTATDQVVNVRMGLGVLNGPTGMAVWFDDASTTKTSGISTGLVTNSSGTTLTTTLSGLLPQGQFDQLLAAVAKKTGATIADVTTAVNNYLTGNSALNGNNVLYGNISSEFIQELTDTWAQTYKGIGNTDTAPANPTAATVEQALQQFAVAMTGQGSLIGLVQGAASKLRSDLDGHTSLITDLQTQVKALQVKTSSTVTTPPTTVTIASFTDDFERTSLGSKWSTYNKVGDGSTMGILNGHDAWFFPPSVTTQQDYAYAAWAGGNSNTDYQQISTVLGSKGGVPAAGTVGYNDLLGRINGNGLTCVLARFFANGTIQFIYRIGSWTENVFGTFNTPTGSAPTTGSLLTFYAGWKATSEQNKFYATVGNATYGPAVLSTSILGSMGRGWGYGMGNGLSLFAPMPAATMNYWSAQDQV